MKLKNLIVAALISISTPTFAQLQSTWSKTFETSVNWQTVSSLGHHIIQNQDQLLNLDPLTGDVIWSTSNYSNLSQSNFSELNNSPFAKINLDKGMYIINLFDGTEVFNSSINGFEKVKQEFVLYQSNTIILSGKTSDKENLTLAIDINNGEVLWKSSEDYGKLIDIIELSPTEILGITLFNNIRMETRTGKTIWENENSAEAKQLANLGGFGNMLKKVAEESVKDVEINLDFNMHPSKNYFIIGAEQKHENTSQLPSGEQQTTITYTAIYRAYNIENGNEVWSKPIETKGRLGYTYWSEGNLLILPNGKQRSKINLYNFETSEGLWGKKGKGIAIKGGVYSYTPSENGLLVITSRNDKNFLNYLDTKNGIFTFDKTIKVKGAVGYTLVTNNGILYATESEMNIVNPVTGELKWPKDLKTHYSLVKKKEDKVYLYDTKEKSVKGVNLSTGLIDYVGKEPIKFKEGESPKKLELRETGILLSSDQNFAFYDYSGALNFLKHYPSPKEAGWKRALLYAGAIYAGYTSAVSGLASGVYQHAGAKMGNNTVEGQVFSGVGKAYGELSASAGNAAVKAFKAAGKRFKATKSARNYTIVMSKTENGIALLKINKDSGNVESEILLGKDRKPNYALDLVEGKVFLEVKGKTINCFDLK